VGVRVVGAGVGRTGTLSLKVALERLLGGTCHHMHEVVAHPEELASWQAAAQGDPVDWRELLGPYTATVDWPAAALWPEISAAFPDAVVLLSVRDPDAWYASVRETILTPTVRGIERPAGEDPWSDMIRAVMAHRFTLRLDDPDAAKAAFVAHNARVRAEVDPARLVEWEPSMGWAPICAALDLPVPAEPFPHTNTTAEVRARRSASGPAS
jgi:hypothetical protein